MDQEMGERVERWISLSLDGELAEEDRCELDRALLRDPEARRLMETCRAVDREAGEALREAFAAHPGVARPLWSTRPPSWRDRLTAVHRGWWLAVGTAAAAIAAMWLATSGWPQERRPFVDMAKPSSPRLALSRDAAGSDPSQAALASLPRRRLFRPDRPSDRRLPRIYRRVGRNILGVIDEKGNVYLLEVHRVLKVRSFSKMSHFTMHGGI